MSRPRRVAACIALALSAPALTTPALAQSAPFEENFNFGFENPWDTFTFANDGFYQGLPSGVFGGLGPYTGWRMTNPLLPLEYVGMSPAGYQFGPDVDLIEARINTLVQNFDNIDGLFRMRVVSPGGDSITVGLFGFARSTTRTFQCGGSLAPVPFQSVPYDYQNNTWYRIRIDNSGPETVVSLRDDNGQAILWCPLGHSFADLEGFGTGLYLQIIQQMGTPIGPAQCDVFVDWVRVVPEICPADVSEPLGQLDFSDIIAFLNAYNAMEPLGDIAPPFGQWDFSDISAYLVFFAGGCP